MKIISSCLALVVCSFSIASIAAKDLLEPGDDPNNLHNSLLLSPLHWDHERMLQSGMSCRKADHGVAFICDQTTSDGNYIKYTIPCDGDYFDAGECLKDGVKVCYQYNNVPCIASKFCFSVTMYAMDCSNLYAESTGAECGITNCNAQCSVAPALLDYNQHSTPSLNACWTAGATSTSTSSEWTHILSDGVEIQITVAKVNGQATSCTAQVPSNGGSCSCSTDCSNTGDFSSVSYDCSAFSSDECAIMGCNGVCVGASLTNANDRVPVTITVAAPQEAPVAPSAPKVPVSIVLDVPATNDVLPAPITLLKPVPRTNSYVKPVEAPVAAQTAVIFTPGTGASAPVNKPAPVAVAPSPVPQPVVTPVLIVEAPMDSPRVPVYFPVKPTPVKPTPDYFINAVPVTTRTPPTPPPPVPNVVADSLPAQNPPTPPPPVPNVVAAPLPAPTPAATTTNGNTMYAMPQAPYPNGIPPTTSECQRYPGCVLAKQTDGLCCPTLNGEYLECCNQNAPSPSTNIQQGSNGTHWWWTANTTTTSSIQTEQVSPLEASLASTAAATSTLGVVAIVLTVIMMMYL